MKIPKSILIEKACSGDASRPVLNHAYLQKSDDGNARILATNGIIAAIVPVLADESDTSGYIPGDALKAARKSAGKLETASFSANGVCRMPDGQEFPRPDLGGYPSIDAVIPKEEAEFTISLDPQILFALAQAIGSERGVTLKLLKGGKTIRVLPCNNPRAKNAKGVPVGFTPACLDALGLIMPIVT